MLRSRNLREKGLIRILKDHGLHISLPLGLLCVVGALIFTATRSREPVYQGKTLSAWLAILGAWENPNKPEESPTIAIRQIGTNAIPFLLPALRWHNSQFRIRLHEFVNLQHIVSINLLTEGRECNSAIEAFKILGPIATPAIPSLVQMLPDTNICRAVASALGGIGPNAIPALTNALSQTNQIVREASFEALVNMGTNAESALPVLIAGLQDNNPRIRWAAGLSMSYVGINQPTLAVPPLINTLQDPDPRTCLTAIRSLREFGNKAQAAVPKLTEMLNNPKRAASAAFALATIMGTNEAIAPITNVFTNENTKVCWQLMQVLGSFKSNASNAVPALIPFVRHDEMSVRTSAIQALGEIAREPELVVPALTQNLSETNSRAHYETLNALGKFGPQAAAAVPVLLQQIQAVKNGKRFFSEQELYLEERIGVLPQQFSIPLFESEEFRTLQQIDPAAAAKLRKEIDDQEAKSLQPER